jgi:NAD+ synthase (glutamine-hydrolysing)
VPYTCGTATLGENVRYNHRILLTYKIIFFIRLKISLANDGMYREARHFTAWVKPRTVEVLSTLDMPMG